MSGSRRIFAGIFFLLTVILTAGCAQQAAVTETAPVGPLVATTETGPGDGTSTCACSSGMPLVDETFVPQITDAATAAFEKEHGDGSGVYVVWGPNVVGDWAMMELQNESGANANKALLYLEPGGQWQVMDIGADLAPEWQSQTPPELWPSA